MIDAGKFYEVQKYCAITNHVWDGYWICANPASWNRLPNDIKAIVAKAFNEVALLERDDLNKLDRSLQAELEKKGVTFTKPDLDSLPRQAACGRVLPGMARQGRQRGLDAAREVRRQAGLRPGLDQPIKE